MSKAVIAAAVLWIAFAAPVIAVEGNQPPKAPVQDFDQRKAQLLKMFDERIANIERAKTCVQGAKNQDDIKTCLENRMARRNLHEGNRRPGGPGRPPGP